jgi:hypothetical protein
VYVALWTFGIALGWIEGSVVAYLREIVAREMPIQGAVQALPTVMLPALPASLAGVELVRELATLLALGAVAWIAASRAAGRAGAFLLAFGVWDLTCEAALRLVLGWSERPGMWDVLFPIPAPWVAPVWVRITPALLFVAAGTFLFWTADRERHGGERVSPQRLPSVIDEVRGEEDYPRPRPVSVAARPAAPAAKRTRSERIA